MLAPWKNTMPAEHWRISITAGAVLLLLKLKSKHVFASATCIQFDKHQHAVHLVSIKAWREYILCPIFKLKSLVLKLLHLNRALQHTFRRKDRG